MTESRTIYPAVHIVVQSKTHCSLDCPRMGGFHRLFCQHPAGYEEDLRGGPEKPLRRPWCRKASP